MKYRFAILSIICIASIIAVSMAFAGRDTTPAAVQDRPVPDSISPRQTYSFTVENETTSIFVQYDGILTIEYFITFNVNYYSDDLQYFDIGFPSNDYILSSMHANITYDNLTYPASSITKSDYVPIGVTAYFTYGIPHGKTGVLHLIGNNSGLLYEDTQNSSKASFEFTPTWFDTSIGGSTISNYHLTFYFPPNQNDGNQLVYHQFSSPWKVPTFGLKNFTTPLEQRLFYSWSYSTITQEAHKFGASFPKSWVMDGVVKPAPIDPMIVLGVWIALAACAGVVVLVSVLYLMVKYQKKLRTQYYPPVQKGGNPFPGLCCCAIFAIAIAFFLIQDLSLFLFGLTIALLVLAGAFIAYFAAKALDKRRLTYEKPKLSIQCVGVNKELTVPEAAIVKNTPLGTVIFLIFFGMMRKGLIEIKQAKPLTLEKKLQIFPENLRATPEAGRKIRDYELDLYDVITPAGTMDEAKLKLALIAMIKKTNAKMTGFDLKATIAYHDDLMTKAWNQIKNSEGDIKFDDIADQFEYLVLDEHFATKAPTYIGTRTVYMPYWYSSPVFWGSTGTRGTGGSIPATGPSPFTKPGGLGAMNGVNFAGSLATGLQNISNNIAKNVSSFFNSIVSTVAPPPPKTSSTGGGSRGGGASYGGHSCACACACACAGCACACAGGGR